MSEDKGSFGSTDLNKEESIMFGFSKSKEKIRRTREKQKSCMKNIID